MIDYRKLINLIKEEKDKQGLTLEMLATKSGIARGTLNKLMSSSTKSIKMEHIAKLSNALGLQLTQLLEDEQSESDKLPPYWGYIRVASCTPSLKVANCVYNADKIIETALELNKKQVNVALFPELCITGYTCGDLLFQRTLLDSAVQQLIRISQETADTNLLIAVGLPLSVKSRLYNCAALINKGKLLAIVPKTYLPTYNEFYEGRYFAAAPQQNYTITIGNQQVLFGTKVLLEDQLCPELIVACEICEDVWVANPPSNNHTAAGATIVLNLSASNESAGKYNYRCDMVRMQSAKCIAGYVYCSCGPDESTSDTVFSAHNIIAEYGNVLAQSELFENNITMADIDVQFIVNERNKLYNYRPIPDGYDTVPFYSLPDNSEINRSYSPTPFVNKKHFDYVLKVQAHGLKRRLLHTHADKLVVGVSGGLDSTLALIACANALKLAGRPTSDIIAITMPCFGTTKRTLDNSLQLAQYMGATLMKIDIAKSVKQHLEDIKHDKTDVVLENAQARERTQILMDVANKFNGLVIGTGDLSELALGWCTYNGDQMSMYSVNCDIPKTLVKALVQYVASTSESKLAQILNDIADTPVSPELLPLNKGKLQQKTEDIIGPYKLHDFFLHKFTRMYYSRDKILRIACDTFPEYSPLEIEKWLNLFFKRFITQQYKRSSMPDGVKVGSVNLSPKTDWRMPSDVDMTAFVSKEN